MKEQRIQQWIANFSEQIILVENEFATFFKLKPLKDYYKIIIHEDIGFITIHLLNREDQSLEIINAITVALLRAKPRF